MKQRIWIFIIGFVMLAMLLAFSGIKDKKKKTMEPTEKVVLRLNKVPAVEMMEGVGARVKRLFPTQHHTYFDPFVILDEFAITPPAGFPDHPHRGFEAVTYMIEGGFNHTDNLGNSETVYAGGAQRFTAGTGIVHSEMPDGKGVSHGLQIWVNLPRSQKQIQPSYAATHAKDIPVEKHDGLTIRHVVGNNSPVTLKTEVVYQDIELEAGKNWQVHLPEGHNTIVYVLDGSLTIEDAQPELQKATSYFFQNAPVFTLKTSRGGRCIVLSGKPHNEPILQRGPYVD